MTFKATKADDIRFTMEIEMPLSDWKRLKEQLESGPELTSWPTTGFRDAIRSMVQQAEKQFYPRSGDEPISK